MLVGQNILTIITITQYLILYMYSFLSFFLFFFSQISFGWSGSVGGDYSSVYFKCKWSFFSRANLRREDIGLTCFFMYRSVYTFLLPKTVYAR